MIILVAFLVLAVPVPAAAQDPTPAPEVIPLEVEGESGIFYVVPSVTYGEGGVIVGLFFVSGLLLAQIGLEVVRWLRE